MQPGELQARRAARARQVRRRRVAALGAFGAAVVIAAAIALASGGGSSHPGAKAPTATGGHHSATTVPAPSSTSTVAGTGKPGTESVPVLMYHVINPPPPGAPFPGLYVPASEFAAQMNALKAAGWHAVTLDQLKANWTRGVPLGPGKPIVLTFDNGYQSQYTNALPVLKRLGWVGNEMIQLDFIGLSSQGVLTDAQVRELLTAGWELDTQGLTHYDLITASPSKLHDEVAVARQQLRQRYNVPVDWFAYPSGHYNATVIGALKDAGFQGSLTVIPGWAGPSEDPFRLPRLRVLGGTSPSALLAQIASAQGAGAPPASYP
jgi:peptidoglycan/xylan/chitin deacetylase (PgdA/CDA1 family)